MSLYQHQIDLIQKAPSKHLLAWACGTGKTAASIQLAHNNGSTILVVCPKSVVENWWREIDKWSNRLTKQWFVMSKENFKKYCKDELFIPDVIIFDEAHFAANYKSQIHKALYGYIQKYNIKCVYLLTATPYLSNVWSIYSLARLLGVYWNWLKFKKFFFNEVKMGIRTILVQKKGIEADVAKLVNQLGSTIKLDDCIDVPEQIFENEYFILNKAQLESFSRITDLQPIVRWTKIHQIENGTLKNDGYNQDEIFDCDKTDRVIELCKEHKKIAIVACYNLQIKHYYSLVKGKEKFIINGETKDKQAIVDKVNELDDCVVFINASCAEGFNLWSVPIMVFASYDFSLVKYIQMKGRILRVDYPKKNVYISLITSKGVDEDVYNCVVIKKMDFHDRIFDNTKSI